MGKIFNKIVSRARLKLGLPPDLVRRELLGTSVVIREGSLRNHHDYDDAWLLALARHADTAIDVGAHLGDSALLMLSAGSVRRIILIEPNVDALVLAAENLIRNKASAGASFVPAFAADQAEHMIVFHTVGTGAAGSMYKLHAKSAAKKGLSTEVNTTTLDTVCRQFAMLPDLVKVDVEGAEYNVLLGSKDLARQQSTRLLVEMHSNPGLPMEVNTRRVLDWCKEVNFAAWYLSEGTRLVDPNQNQHRGRCHLLLQPAEWPYPEWLQGIQQSSDPALVLAVR